MSTIQDDDLLIIGRGSDNYKITGRDFIDAIEPPDPDVPPSIGSITLSGTGSGFSGETFTTIYKRLQSG